jgi:ubiquinone/menaquinone biosynthesis C-methylase UbiE
MVRKSMENPVNSDKSVSQHYQHPDLVQAIADALEKQGKSIHTVNTRDLASVDEFHMGGPIATEHFLEGLKLNSGSEIIDLGCGIGGSARFCAQSYGCRVTGIDLTKSYIKAAKVLTRWVELSDLVNFNQGSVLSLQSMPEQFDCAYMMHLGMNIEDKTQLFKEAARVLKSKGCIAIYDILNVGEGELNYPLPWASDKANSHLATLESYRQALDSADFEVELVNNRQDFAKRFYRKMAVANQPKALSLHILMQQDAAKKIANMVSGLTENIIAPFEIYARKR